MTKKVLISLEDYVNLFSFDGKTTDESTPDCACADCINYITFKRWFDAQREITAVIYSESSAKMAEFAALSKMETTGDEDADTR